MFGGSLNWQEGSSTLEKQDEVKENEIDSKSANIVRDLEKSGKSGQVSFDYNQIGPSFSLFIYFTYHSFKCMGL